MPGQNISSVEPGAQRGHADVVDQRHAAAGRRDQHAVGRRVQREQHEVVHDGRAREPDQHPQQRRVAEQEERGVRGEREARHQQRELGGGGADAPGQRDHHAARKVIERTHFVQCTPGSAGTITRAG